MGRYGRVLETPPARLYEMKRKHEDKYWQCVKLAAKAEHDDIALEKLETEHCDFAYCELCRMTIYCVKGNHEVGNHMRIYHAAMLEEFERNEREEKERQQLLVHADSNKRHKKAAGPVSTEDQVHANHLLAKWIAESMRPLTLVEDSGFVEYVDFITRVVGGVEVAIPGRTALRETIRGIAREKRASLAVELTRGCKYYSLTTDLWTDRGLRSFMSTTVHYVDASFKTFSWLLAIRSVPGKHDAARIKTELKAIMDEWKLQKAHCAMLLRDGAKNAVNAAELLDVPHMSCVAHSLHLVVGAALLRKSRRSASSAAAGAHVVPTSDHNTVIAEEATDEAELEVDEEYLEVDGDDAAEILEAREGVCRDVEALIADNISGTSDLEYLEEMRDIVAKFRKIATYFHKSSKGKNRLGRFQNDNEVKHLILDCPTRWSSTFEMLQRFEELKTPLTKFFTSWVVLDVPSSPTSRSAVQSTMIGLPSNALACFCTSLHT